MNTKNRFSEYTAIWLKTIVFCLACQPVYAVVIPASDDQAFNARVRAYLEEAKTISKQLSDLIRTAETVPNVIYI